MNEMLSCARIAKSSVSGKMDVAQASSGVLLALFTLFHGLFVASVLISPKLMNVLGWFFEATYLAQLGAPLLLFLLFIHFLLAVRKMPLRLGEFQTFLDHAKRMRHPDTWLWLVQTISAALLIIMVSAHIYTMMMNFPMSAQSSALREQNGWTGFYCVLLITVALHLGIGLFRVAVKYGVITDKTRSLWKKRMWIVIGAYIALGALTIIRFNYLAV